MPGCSNTLVSVLAYVVMLGVMFSRNSDLINNTLPRLPAGIVALLGISSEGYLVNKVIPHS